jgi:NAD(P)-dependent dehydrogenase (short-subunit alcohol dehydrogenase family)
MDKELLIFGANGALGKGVTGTLSKMDFNKIYLFDFNLDGLPENQKIIKKEIKDLSDEKNVKAVFENILPSKEKLFFLYSTIGGFSAGRNIWDAEIDEWDKMMGMNLKSSFLIAKYFAGLVKESAGGSICFTAAMVGINPEEKKVSYGVSKSGLIHLVKTISLEGRIINLTANAIAPYMIDTPANRNWEKNTDIYNQWIKPVEIGKLAYMLFSNFHFITGNVLTLTKRLNINI